MGSTDAHKASVGKDPAFRSLHHYNTDTDYFQAEWCVVKTRRDQKSLVLLVTPSILSDHTYAAAVASKILLHYAQIATEGHVLCEVSAGRNFAVSELQLRSPRWHGSPQAVRVSTSSEEKFVKMYQLSARAATQDGRIAPQSAKGQHKAWPDAAVTAGKACFVSGTREQLTGSTVPNKKHRCSINRAQSLMVIKSDRSACSCPFQAPAVSRESPSKGRWCEALPGLTRCQGAQKIRCCAISR